MDWKRAEEINRQFGGGTAIPMDVLPTPKQQRLRKVGRNEPCPCGSGKKFKKCHLLKQG